MNKVMFAAVVAAVVCTGAAEAADPVKCPALDKTYLIGEAVGKDSPYYKVGDEIVYSMKLRGVGEGLKADDWTINWTRTGDDGIVENGTAALPVDEPLVIRTKATKPGSVKVEAKLVGKDDKVYHKQECYDWDDHIFFTGTALVEPEKVAPVAEPADFDAFWKGAKAKLAAVPMEVLERRQIKVDGPNADVFAIKVACAGERPVTGYLSLPKLRKPGDKYPAIVEFDGYGCGKMRPYDGGLGQREILFHINAHGYDLDQEGDYYQKFNDSISVDNTGYAFSEKQNSKPETAYFYGMTLRVMRALQFVKSLPEWDGRNLTANGGSQGGLQAVWAAGLDPDVNKIVSEITWCCDLGGEKLGRLRGPWYITGTDALRYFDPVNHAKRINPKAKFTCPRAGLGDYTCPPMGLWMLYNAVPCAKSIHWVQSSTHGTVPPKPNQTFDESQD